VIARREIGLEGSIAERQAPPERLRAASPSTATTSSSTNVVLDNAVESPLASGVTFEHLVTQWFKNAPASAINHIINGTGPAVSASNTGATTPD
jgi:hypothetical protein